MNKAKYVGESVWHGEEVQEFEYYGWFYFVPKHASEAEKEKVHRAEQRMIHRQLGDIGDDWGARLACARANNM